jgi:tetratricopeptide (TPR) repeat protein
MRRHLSVIVLFLTSIFAGCGKQHSVAPTASAASPNVATHAANPGASAEIVVSLTPKELTAEEKHNQALFDALRHLATRDYADALNSLQAAQAAKETEQTRELLVRLHGLQIRAAAFDQTVADIQSILDQGHGEQAAQLVIAALGQYSEPEEAAKLGALKRQADALLAAAKPDIAAQITRWRAEAENALKENNLRAAQLALDQALALRPDAALQQRAEELKARLAKYDAARDRAAQLRKDPLNLEEAMAAYQEAVQAWDTLQVREEMADVQLALQKRRDRLAVASFEVRGDSRLADLGLVLANELIPHFKRRYDLVERSQINQVLAELNLGHDDLLVSEQGRHDLGRIAKARYLVVGSVSPLNGVTVHARLIDLRSGLIVQTGKIIAPTAEQALKKSGQLAAMLMMSDEERLVFERQLAQEKAPAVVTVNGTVPAVPAVRQGDKPEPLQMSSHRPPDFGLLKPDDFDRLPSLPTLAGGIATPVAEPIVFLEQERPLRNRLLTLHIEIGDHYFRRGLYQEALLRFQLARELEPANIDILTRINLCQPHLPPGPLIRRRDRVAFVNFFVVGDPRVVPPVLSSWSPEHLAPYFSPVYEVVDRSEVNWMMARLGLTLGDVIREHSARRWLARSLGVRYLVLGRIQQTGSFTVTSSLVDAEQGWEVGRGQVFVRDAYELKLRLPELARLTLLSPAERARLEQLAAAQEAEFLRAQEAFHRGQFTIALNLATGLKKKHPFNVRIEFLINECDHRSRLEALQEARRREAEQLRQQAEAAARRQAELVLAAERARQEAMQRALAEAERQRLRDAAQQQLVLQARVAFKNNQIALAIQLFDGAVAFRPSDDALLREAAAARARGEAERRRLLVEQEARRTEGLRRQRDLELTSARQQWIAERKQFDQGFEEFHKLQLTQQTADYTRLLDQAQRLKAQGRFDQAATLLQSAKRIKHTDEVDRLLADALMEQARAQAKAQDAARLAELERKLAQEQARRKQAEQEAQRNWQLYQTALQAAQEAQQHRNFTVAVAKYQEAGRLFQTDAVITGLQTAKAAVEQEAQLLAIKQKEEADRTRRVAEVTRLLTTSRAAEQARKYDEALTTLNKAKELDPGNVDVMAALTRVEQLKVKAIEVRQARDQAARVKALITQAQGRAKAQQFDAALALLTAAQNLSPNDTKISDQITAVKKAQADVQAAIVAAKQRVEEAKRQTALRIEQEERAKQQAIQVRQQAETALASGDLKSAEAALASASKLAPKDPALRKLHQELTRAQGAAARERAQADARAKLEAEAHRRQSAAALQQQSKITDILRQAQAAMAKKDFTDAEKLINDAIALDPTNLAIGKAQRELQGARKADSDARAAMTAEQKKKNDAELAKKKAEFSQLMKDGKEALAAEEYDKAAKLFEAAIKLNPEDADAPLLLGMARRDIERAKAEAEAARKAAMEEEARQKKEEEAARMKEKAEAEAKKKAEQELQRRLAMDADAKKRADALKALNKQQFDAVIKAGNQALASKKYDDAIKAFERATQLMPDDKEAQTQLQTARRLKDAAAKEPEKKMPTPGKKPFTPEKKAPTPDRKSEPEKKPASKKPTEPGAPSSAQLLSQAAQLQRQQKWNDALQLYRQVLSANPNDRAAKAGITACEFQIHLEAGKGALAKKNKEEAIKSFEAAVKLVPNHPEAQKLLKQAKDLK